MPQEPKSSSSGGGKATAQTNTKKANTNAATTGSATTEKTDINNNNNNKPPSTDYTTITTAMASPPTDDDDDDAMDRQEAARIKHWKESPFAVGLVKVTWKDEQIIERFTPRDYRNNNSSPLVCSAYCCGCLGADRVGNMAVLAQTTEEYDHFIVNEETGERTTTRKTRPKLLWVVGPYWPVNLFLTFPLIIGISLWTGMKGLNDEHPALIAVWLFCTVIMIFALAMVACRNPGILYRHSEKPPGADAWRWNDQSKTFRPPKARYDPECGVVIEGFDHTCPWTGTAIGSRNMFWFRIFVTMIPICILWAVAINIFL